MASKMTKTKGNTLTRPSIFIQKKALNTTKTKGNTLIRPSIFIQKKALKTTKTKGKHQNQLSKRRKRSQSNP